MKSCLVALCLLLMLFQASYLSAQTASPSFCGTSEMREKLLKIYPELLEKEAALERETMAYIKSQGLEKSNEKQQGQIIIPLVVHVINEGGPENISDAQVLDEVRIMNLDYNKLNSDTASVTDSTLSSIIANMGVEWRLANIDPNGNCTNGIDRVRSDQTWWGDDNSKLNDWPNNKYVNVWLVEKIANGAAGYAYFPSSIGTGGFSVSAAFDGVLLLSNYTGSIGTGSSFTSRALTHEIGHCFNLEHTWGNGNVGTTCGDDGVNDTPLTKGWTACPSPANAKVCNPLIEENYQNFMDYSYCNCMFTNGQKARWLAAANSATASRNNLWSNSNLVATGTADTFRNACAPIADFVVNNRYVCAGDSVVKFSSTSGNGAITTYYWQFPTGTPSTAATANVTVKFTQLGWQTAKLTVSNGLGSNTKTDSFLVYVGADQPTYVAPYYEGFEDPNIFNKNTWASVNYEENNVADNNVTWFKQVSSASHTGTGSAQLNNWNAVATHDIDEIVSPGFDLIPLTTPQMTLSFYYSIATAAQFTQFLGIPPDSMVVYASANCSENWQPIYTNGSASTFINAGTVTSAFTPSSANQWKQVTINLSPSLRQLNVRFKFRVFTTLGGVNGVTGGGNNFYIDDINIGNAVVPTEVKTISALGNVNLYPNPTGGDATLELNLLHAGNVSVKLYDLTGKVVMTCYNGWMNNGETRVMIEGSNHLSRGVYIVNVVADESVEQLKLIVQ